MKETELYIRALFGGSQVEIMQTDKAVTPYGGLLSYLEFLSQIKLTEQIQKFIPFTLSSPNAINPAHTLLAFMMTVIVGGQRFAHTEWIRYDKVLHALLGIDRFPGNDTVRNFFARFGMSQIQAFWRPLWRWSLTLLVPQAQGYSLDLDSTVFQRSGHQQGAARGYNPQRRGRNSQHPLLAVFQEAHFIVHSCLRPGNAASANGVVEFLKEALAQLPEKLSIRTIRADSGFFQEGLLYFLENRGLKYIIAARMTTRVKAKAASRTKWKAIDRNLSMGEFWAQLDGWSKKRRFIVIREIAHAGSEPTGRFIFDKVYTYRVFVTNRLEEDALCLWRDYNQRANVEQRIEELKTDLAADGFCMQDFFATESAYLAVLFTYNLLSLYQSAAHPQQPYRQPSTLRSSVFICGAVLGTRARKIVLYLSSAYGGLNKHKPLLEAVLNWSNPTSAKIAFGTT